MHHRQRSGTADFGKNFCPLSASASFPMILSAGSGASGCPRMSHPSHQKLERRKKKFFLYGECFIPIFTLYGECLAETPPPFFFLRAPPRPPLFFLRAPPKRIHLPRLRLLYSSHCSLRFFGKVNPLKPQDKILFTLWPRKGPNPA